MGQHARGTFEVTMTPQGQDGTAVDRMVLAKVYRGDLEATGTGQMLAVRTAVPGSAGYVAIERVTGTLQGRAGTFALQHGGTMTRGTPHLTVAVIPDSGTGALEGLSGTLTIAIAEGVHSYDFTYSI